MPIKDSPDSSNSIVPGGGDKYAFTALVECESGEEREGLIQDLISEMSLVEKIRQMSGSTNLLDLAIMVVRYNLVPVDSGENRRLCIPPIRFTDGPRGIGLNHSTCFPVSMARGATWDTELEERVGSAMGVEARAQGANFFGGVCVNIPRHPGWGRAQETFGDDPFHVGIMGVSAVRGLQRHVMACAKHYACNSIDESRFYVDVRIDERTLREIYLPHFRRCVRAGVASIMSAYNKVNGTYCAQNRHLLRDILKGDWGFEGFVVSDFFWGTRDTVRAANGGLDIEMPNTRYFGRRLKRAVRRGDVPESAIDEAVTRIIRRKAEFAKVGDPEGYDREKVACSEHTELALEVSRKSIVLLKNENGALPLDREEVKRIAVVGKLADMPNLGDVGSSQVRPPYAVTPLQGIRDRAGESVRVIYDSGKELVRVAMVASRVDAVVVVVGLSHRDEGEAMPVIHTGGDRAELGLSVRAENIIKAAAEANDRCIVVLEGGSAITMENWKDEVAAILMAWYPGMEGGNAIADVLFGDVNPGGKLPVIFPETTEQLPHLDKKASTVEYGYYHGYRLFDKEGLEPAFPFGFGLSYTGYEYNNLRLSRKQISGSDSVDITFDITNTGEVAGEEIAQLYIGYDGSSVDRPVKELKGFTKVNLEPGETKTVTIELDAEELAYYDTGSGEWKIEEIAYAVYVGSSSREADLHLSDTLTVSGE